MKLYIAWRNATFTINKVRDLFIESAEQITPEKWAKCVGHVMLKVKPQIWSLDGIIDCLVKPMIINLQEDSNSDDDFFWNN